MSIAENLRRDADDALNNGGMYYSGEYLDVIAKKVEEVEAENEKLREMVAALWECSAWETDSVGWCEECDYHDTEEGGCKVEKSLRKLGIEVE